MAHRLLAGERAERVSRAILLVDLLVLVLGLAFFTFQGRSWEASCDLGNRCDARVFRAVGELLRQGSPVYDWAEVSRWWLEDSGRSPGLVLPFAYPPTALPVFAPWGWLRPELLAPLLAGAGALAYFAVLARMEGRVFGLLSLLGSWAFFSSYLGQYGLWTGAAGGLLLLGLRPGGDERVAGLGLGLLLAFKPHYALFALLALLAARRFRPLGAALAVTAALALLSGLLYGFGRWAEWLAAVGGELGGRHPLLDSTLMSNWFALYLPLAGLPPSALVLAVALLGLLLAGLGGWWLGAERGAALALLLALLASPHSHPYDLSLWMPVLAVERGRPGRALGYALWSWLFILRATCPLGTLWLSYRLLRCSGRAEARAIQ